MRLRRHSSILLILIALGIPCGIMLSFNSRKEPEYQGRALSDWLTEFDSWDGNTNAPVCLAIRGMGQRAVPLLVEISLAPTDSKLKQVVASKVYTDPKLKGLRFPIAPILWARANMGLSVLGDEARTALPMLKKGLNHSDPVVRARAATALGHLGPLAEEAIPLLLAHQMDQSMRPNIMLALGMIGCQPEPSRQVLTYGLSDTNSLVARNAQQALSHFGKFKYGRITP